MSGTGEAEGEGDLSATKERRRPPQSLNQRNAELLQSLAQLRSQKLSQQTALRHSDLHSAGMEPAIGSNDEDFQSTEAVLPTQGKSFGRVKMPGRRRLCKVLSDDALSFHSGVSDESETCEKPTDDNSEVRNTAFQSFSGKESPQKKTSASGREKNNGLDEISSKFNSLSIKSFKPKGFDKMGSQVAEKTEFLDSGTSKFSSLGIKDVKTKEFDKGLSSVEEKTAVFETCKSLKKTMDSENDEESVGPVREEKEELNSTVHSLDAPEFESAVSQLSSLSVKGGDGEEDSAQSLRHGSIGAVKDAAESENFNNPTNSNANILDINKSNGVDLRVSKPVEQNSKIADEASVISVSSSLGRPVFLSSEDDNDSSYSAESVKSKSRSHALVAKGHGEWEKCIGIETKNRHKYEGVIDTDEDEIDVKDSDGITHINGKQTYMLPGKIAKSLYAHQRDGIKWLWALHCKSRGGILGDDMGLGKTMQICAFLAGLYSSSLIKCALIVAPKTLLAHWMKELSVVGLSRKMRDYSGNPGNVREYALQYVLQVGGVLLTTYDVVRNNWKSIRGDFHGRDGYGDTSDDIVTWDYVILDEGHIIKNPSTQRAKSLREIPSGHRIILSGTPIQNNLREMWALFDFCCPNLLGDKKEFKARYEDVILRANDKKASDRQKRIGSAVAQELRERIRPYFLRRLKSEVFPEAGDSASQKLARKDDIIVWLCLTECQRQLYTAFLNSETALSSVDGSALAALTVLKKICDHPALLTKRAADDIAEGMESMLGGAEMATAEEMAASLASIANLEEGQRKQESVSCKIAFLMALLDNLIAEDHRVLVFSQTRKMLNFIQEEIKCRGYGFLRIDGTTKACDREKLVNEFQAGDEIPIFLLTSRVGGLGLTLTGADRVVVIDPNWNPSTDNQSVDRAYRIGQLRNVLVYRLMTCGTIEEKIYRKQVFKGGLFKTATEHKEQTRYFSQEELHELFSIPETGFDISPTQQQLHEEHDRHHQIDDSLKQHIEFLKGQGIAGVSHHNLLYSKTAPVQPPAPEDEAALRWNPCKKEYATPASRPASRYSKDDMVNGNEYAFKPKDYKPVMYDTPILRGSHFEQNSIKENIKRLSQTLANKEMISRLPDKGLNIERKIIDLTNQLDKLQTIARGVDAWHVPESKGSHLSTESAEKNFEGYRLHEAASLKENLQRERTCGKEPLSENISDMSRVLSNLSVLDIED